MRVGIDAANGDIASAYTYWALYPTYFGPRSREDAGTVSSSRRSTSTVYIPAMILIAEAITIETTL